MKPPLTYALIAGCMAVSAADLPRSPTRIDTLSKWVSWKVARFVDGRWNLTAPHCTLTPNGKLWFVGDIEVSGRREPYFVSEYGQPWQTCEDMAEQQLTYALEK